jgi:glyoxylase-like metal-dependent hydrolase (beta-lactamase superfamily II)
MGFVREPEPARGILLPVMAGVGRIVAPNPSLMTYHGTNTWVVEDGSGGISVIDPGPNREEHVAAVVAACAGRVARILVTHGHSDHVGAAQALREATGARAYGAAPLAGATFVPDHVLGDGDSVAGLRAVFTPGHAADHLCFAFRDDLLFSGDHVMGWASSIVSPPEGDMTAYFASLERLLTAPYSRFLCGHGPVVDEPAAHVRSLLAHRIRRERAIAAAVRTAPAGSFELMDRLYSKLDPILRWAAERNVLAHLHKLRGEGVVRCEGDVWRWVGS